MIFNVSGGGGAALNFRVVGGTTAPTNPAENCIWVNTNTAITSWIFSATEPSPAEAGMVWISIGVYSVVEFNALKKNGIRVYPLSAKQHVSGAWVDKTAMSYQSGVWVDWWRGELYDSGNTWDDFSTGWDIMNNKGGSSSFQNNHILCTWHSSSGAESNIVTKGKISFPYQKYTKLKMDIQVDSYIAVNSFPGIFGLRTSNSLCEATSAFSHYKTFTRTGRQTVELNLSGVTGNFYICTMVMFVGKIFKIWME